MQESWDFGWMLAATQSLETYEAALETAEFPSLLLAALEELLQSPETNTEPLQELSHVLLQMIEFPIDLELAPETVTTLHAARDWAIQTLLDVQAPATSSISSILQPPTMSKSLQHMQTKLFVSAPCRLADVQMELHQSLITAVEGEEDAHAVAEVLGICADKLQSDEQFLQFAEVSLSGKTEALVFESAFLQRLFERRASPLQVEEHLSEHRTQSSRRLFDALTLESKICVWANHLPSWRGQLQTWMLEAHRAPLEPIRSVLPSGWFDEDQVNAASFSSVAATERYSHLYVTFVEWCQSHVGLLSSYRSMELVSALSRNTRPANAAKLFNRQLLCQVPLMNHGSWSPYQRELVFTALGRRLEKIQTTRRASDFVWQYEWIGVLERPNLLHEALETIFCGDADGSAKGEEKRPAVHYATNFFSWFYSFSHFESADEIAALLTQISSELKVSDIGSGAQWLRRSRADFGDLPILRLRFVWFWLLKSIEVALQERVSVSDSHTTAFTTDVLESVEYIFRRFTPPRAKRPFQVELVTQLLVELEWRALNADEETKDAFLDKIEPLCAWLTKIVRLMQLEEQTAHQKDTRSRRNPVNDVQHLAERLEPFYR